MRVSVKRGRPYGQDARQRQTARLLGLEATFRPHGRPPKQSVPAVAGAEVEILFVVAKTHTMCYIQTVKPYDWDEQKNDWLRQERGISFEDVLFHLAHGGLLDTIEHPNKQHYPGQRIFVVNVDGYACIVPFVEDDAAIFLKTIIPSRKMTRHYLKGDSK